MTKIPSYSPCCNCPVLANDDYRGQFRQLYCYQCNKILLDCRTKKKFLKLVGLLRWERSQGSLILRCMGVIVADARDDRWFVQGTPIADVLNLHQCALADGFASQSEAELSLRRYVRASVRQIIETIPARRPVWERKQRAKRQMNSTIPSTQTGEKDSAREGGE